MKRRRFLKRKSRLTKKQKQRQVQSKLKKLLKTKEKGFVLDCTTAIPSTYNPMRDESLKLFLGKITSRKILRKSGLITRFGRLKKDRVRTGCYSARFERTLKIPAYIYNKGNNPGKTS